jgi:hypothetical protein
MSSGERFVEQLGLFAKSSCDLLANGLKNRGIRFTKVLVGRENDWFSGDCLVVNCLPVQSQEVRLGSLLNGLIRVFNCIRAKSAL